MGGLFEFADKDFKSFWLADFRSESAFTSQLRIPVGWYGQQPAKELALATHTMMGLVVDDAQFTKDIKSIARDPKTRLLCQQHLLRSGDKVNLGDPVEYGIKQTFLEGIVSDSAVFAAIIEADGIPGYEQDLWGGLSAALNEDMPTKITAGMPPGLLVPMTVHGKGQKDPLINKDGRMRVRPEVTNTWREVQRRRTAIQHAAWAAYKRSGSVGLPPVRFGLYYPFKSSVVRRTSEALMICRAIVHNACE